jgi:hypothetical protein
MHKVVLAAAVILAVDAAPLVKKDHKKHCT